MSRKRIAITGMGGLCSIGTDIESIWRSMMTGRSGLGPLDIDLRDLKTTVGGQIRELDDSVIDPRQRQSMGRFSVLAVLAAHEAASAAGLSHDMDKKRIGSVIGTAVWGADAVDESYRHVFLEGKKRANIFTVPRGMPSAPAAQVSMHLGLRGPVFGVTSACSSANHAISSAIDQIRLGRADVMFAGGTDAPLQFGIIKAWEALRVLARESCRPFSADRDGLVLAEGAGVFVLECWEHAVARGATILAEVIGCGQSADAADIVSPTLEGPTSAMQDCLRDAGIAPESVDYVNAHGTGTRANDAIETKAIRNTFGRHADKLSVSSTKSMHGHCLGGSGAIELIACVQALRDQKVPPTIGYSGSDPDCDLDYTPNVARERRVEIAMSNAFAFGGLNAVVAVRRAK